MRKKPTRVVPRPSLRRFALLMEAVLRDNDSKGGWEGCDARWLIKRLKEEVEELEEVVNSQMEREYNDMMERMDPSRGWRGAPSLRRDIAHEAADVANFALMLADRFGNTNLRGRVVVLAQKKAMKDRRAA